MFRSEPINLIHQVQVLVGGLYRQVVEANHQVVVVKSSDGGDESSGVVPKTEMCTWFVCRVDMSRRYSESSGSYRFRRVPIGP